MVSDKGNSEKFSFFCILHWGNANAFTLASCVTRWKRVSSRFPKTLVTRRALRYLMRRAFLLLPLFSPSLSMTRYIYLHIYELKKIYTVQPFIRAEMSEMSATIGNEPKTKRAPLPLTFVYMYDRSLYCRFIHVDVILTCQRNPHERLGNQYSE